MEALIVDAGPLVAYPCAGDRDHDWAVERFARLSNPLLERFKKYRGRSERGFLRAGEALAKEHAHGGLRLSRNEASTQKDRSSSGYGIS
jgi:hypothetical protein